VRPSGTSIKDLQITSTGECFNGIYVAGGSYTFSAPKISLTGNGRSDFTGMGRRVSTGTSTKWWWTAPPSRTKASCDGRRGDGRQHMIVKNSTIQTSNGTLPSDYHPATDTTQMRSVPWMLGLSGNVRATNLLGDNTKASYINDQVSSEGWGVLSVDEATTGN